MLKSESNSEDEDIIQGTPLSESHITIGGEHLADIKCPECDGGLEEASPGACEFCSESKHQKLITCSYCEYNICLVCAEKKKKENPWVEDIIEAKPVSAEVLKEEKRQRDLEA
jgi:hypothetical protein